MSTTKVAISIQKDLLEEIDEMVKMQLFPNRSKAIQEAVREKVSKINRSRLAVECSKLDPKFEQALADEGFPNEFEENLS